MRGDVLTPRAYTPSRTTLSGDWQLGATPPRSARAGRPGQRGQPSVFLLTICWRPSRTLAEATWTAGAARRRRASLRGKDDLAGGGAGADLQRSHRSEATGSVRNPRPAARSARSFAKAVSSINKREEIDRRARFAVDTTGAGSADAGRRAPRSRTNPLPSQGVRARKQVSRGQVTGRCGPYASPLSSRTESTPRARRSRWRRRLLCRRWGGSSSGRGG